MESVWWYASMLWCWNQPAVRNQRKCFHSVKQRHLVGGQVHKKSFENALLYLKEFVISVFSATILLDLKARLLYCSLPFCMGFSWVVSVADTHVIFHHLMLECKGGSGVAQWLRHKDWYDIKYDIFNVVSILTLIWSSGVGNFISLIYTFKLKLYEYHLTVMKDVLIYV